MRQPTTGEVVMFATANGITDFEDARKQLIEGVKARRAHVLAAFEDMQYETKCDVLELFYAFANTGQWGEINVEERKRGRQLVDSLNRSVTNRMRRERQEQVAT